MITLLSLALIGVAVMTTILVMHVSHHVAHADSGFDVQYLNGDTNLTSNDPNPHFLIDNNSGSSTPLSSLSLLYYFTAGGTQQEIATCDYTPIGCDNVTFSFQTFWPPAWGADTALVIGFTAGAGNLDSGSSLEIQVHFHKSDWSNYDQTQAYSWDEWLTSYTPWFDVVLNQMQEGPTTVWGYPPSFPTADYAGTTSNYLATVGRGAIGVNEAAWDANMLDSNYPQLLQNAGAQIMRYPGGSTADNFHWFNQSLDCNSTDTSTGCGTLGSNGSTGVNFDQFMNTVQQAGAQAMITLNYGSGSWEEAANWVAYANKNMQGYNNILPAPSYAGASPTGHAYGIQYWEVGNEVYGNGTYGTGPNQWEHDSVPALGPVTYADWVNLYSRQMKKVDSSIQIGAVLTAPGNWPDGVTLASQYRDPNLPANSQRWNDVVLKEACNSIDFVDVHWYPQAPNGSGNGGTSDPQLLSSVQNGISDHNRTPSIASMVTSLKNKINQYCGDHASAVQIMITETNSVYAQPGRQTTSQVNALFMDDSVTTWLEQGVANVDWWAAHNSPNDDNNTTDYVTGYAENGVTTYGDFGLLSVGQCTASGANCEPSAETPFPSYYGMQMLTHFIQPGDSLVQASSTSSQVVVHTAVNHAGHLKVLLINEDPYYTHYVNVDLSQAQPSSTATVYTYGNYDSSIQTGSVDMSSSSANVTLLPYSLTVIDAP